MRSRPDWTHGVRGVPYECVARLHPNQVPVKADLQVHPHKVAVIRPGQAQPTPCAPCSQCCALIVSRKGGAACCACTGTCASSTRREHSRARTLPCREDVYELAYCYDARASNQDVFRRSVEPFARKLLEGCNVNVAVLGSTQSGKELLLEGSDTQGGAQSPASGIIHQFLEYLFKELHTSSIQVRCAACLALRSRTPTSQSTFAQAQHAIHMCWQHVYS